ncbi:ABC transporter substrate-binding protein [Streptococcus sp. DD13]|uniref:ABC transporter substrate-binding protein n=1 Tax=Streptococcus sp. DD13 TaxID=1777881 RepID=UPI00079360E8|nr:ABC transporter substrate-binding protein [Streptococcus sp. DD13]KXT79171.1 ABC transporter substrate-binding protein [Streptococcus sp. DD13]
MKILKKLLAPTLVVAVLLTSLTLLHISKSKRSTTKFRIGISQYVAHVSLDAAREGFIDELAKNGYIDGDTIELDYQNAQGEQRNLKTISKQLTESSDLVLAIATPAAISLQATSKEVPIFFTAVTDPVSSKLVENADQPDGNLTGTTDKSPDMQEKQIDLLKEVLPKAKTVGILYTQSESNSVIQKESAAKLLKEKGYQVVEKTILDSNNVKAAAESLMSEVDVVFIPTDNTIASTMSTLKQLSLKYKVPIIGGATGDVDNGGLYTYGTNYEELGRQTARMVIKHMKGKTIKDLPVENPEKLVVHINKDMAKELGIDISSIEGK